MVTPLTLVFSLNLKPCLVRDLWKALRTSLSCYSSHMIGSAVSAFACFELYQASQTFLGDLHELCLLVLIWSPGHPT